MRGQRAGHAPAPPLLEEFVDLTGAGASQVAEQLGGEVAVALGEEGLGRRRQRVEVAGPAAPGLFFDVVVVGQEPVLFEARQLLAHGGRRE